MMDDDGWGKILQQIRGELAPLVPRPTDNPKELLYHYTGSAGLLGILQTRKLWLTHYEYLNDPGEVVSGETLMQKVLDSAATNAEPDSGVECFLRLASMQFHEASLSEHEIFVASFSERDDDLSQWRAYGSDGSGYALGFRFNVVDKPRNPADTAAIVRCVYDLESRRDAFDEMAQKCADVFRQYAEIYARERSDPRQAALEIYHEIAVPLMTSLAENVLRHKSIHYESEREWRIYRLVHSSKSNSSTRYRSTPTGVIPYLDEELLSGEDASDVKRIVVGPSPDIERRTRAVKRLVRDLGFDAEVVASTIAYRGAY